MRFTFDPMMADSVSFPVGGINGTWYIMHPAIAANLKAAGDNAAQIEAAKQLGYKIRKKRGTNMLEVIDPARPQLRSAL